jgi:hypothetical protein
MLQLIISLLGLSLLLVGSLRGGGAYGASAGKGSVSISTNRSVYAPDDAIAVTVQNTLSTPIYGVDTQASCSILALQYQVSGTWHPSQVAPCPQKRPARPVKIDAGGTYTTTITAGYPGVQQLTFPKGSYRLVLIYATSPDGFASASVTVTSPTITVQ